MDSSHQSCRSDPPPLLYNFKEGQQAGQVENCRAEVEDLNDKIDEMDSSLVTGASCSAFSSPTKSSLPDASVHGPLMKQMTPADIKSDGTPVLVFTDIGRDVDDEMALVLLS